MSMSKNRVILIGIDGTTWELIDKFIEEGKLSTFSRLKKEGSWGILKSTIPCYSPLAWNSIFTGVSPLKHGILGFVKHKYNSSNLVPLNSTNRNFPALWNYANYYNIESAYINIPFSYPVEEVKGIFVSGLGTPHQDCQYTSPLDFKEYIKREFPGYRIDYDEELMTKKTDRELFAKECFRLLDFKLNLMSDIFINQPWQLFSSVIRATDIFQHFCWDDQEIIRDAYKKIDVFLGSLINKMSDLDTLIIVSDHGFLRLKNMVHLVNFFIQEGYVVIEGRKKVKKGLSIQLIKNIILRLGGTRLLEILKRNSRLRNSLINFLPIGKYSYLTLVDWQNSLLSYAEGSGGFAYINPIIKADTEKSNSLLKELREKALNLCDQEGGYAIEDVYMNEHIDSGDRPDITFRVKPGYCIDGYDSYDNSVFGKSKSGYLGMHDEDGLIAIYGSKVKKGLNLPQVGVYDILPTILAILTKEIPLYLDGRVLQEAFAVPSDYKVVNISKDSLVGTKRSVEDYSKDERLIIEEKLKNLGYL